MNNNWYAYLGLSPEATAEEIQGAVERLSRQASALAATPLSGHSCCARPSVPSSATCCPDQKTAGDMTRSRRSTSLPPPPMPGYRPMPVQAEARGRTATAGRAGGRFTPRPVPADRLDLPRVRQRGPAQREVLHKCGTPIQLIRRRSRRSPSARPGCALPARRVQTRWGPRTPSALSAVPAVRSLSKSHRCVKP